MSQCTECFRGPCGQVGIAKCDDQDDSPRSYPKTTCPDCGEKTHYDPRYSEQECEECGETFYMDGDEDL